MSTPIVITFGLDGTAHCLYNELIDLQQLGRLCCRRASVVEFNPETQQWEVKHPALGTVLHSHPSRQTCLDWELAHLQ